MPCLTRVPTFRTFQASGRKASAKHTKNCANADIKSVLVVGAAVATINGQVAVALSTGATIPGLAFTDELVVGLSGRLPQGVSMSLGGTLSGTPAAGTAGTYPLVANAMGANGRISSLPFNLVIAA